MKNKTQETIYEYSQVMGGILDKHNVEGLPVSVSSHLMGCGVMAAKISTDIVQFMEERLASQNSLIDQKLHDHPAVVAEASAYRMLIHALENEEAARLRSELEDAVRMLLEDAEAGIPRITQSRGAEMLGLTAMEMREKRKEWAKYKEVACPMNHDPVNCDGCEDCKPDAVDHGQTEQLTNKEG